MSVGDQAKTAPPECCRKGASVGTGLLHTCGLCDCCLCLNSAVSQGNRSGWQGQGRAGSLELASASHTLQVWHFSSWSTQALASGVWQVGDRCPAALPCHKWQPAWWQETGVSCLSVASAFRTCKDQAVASPLPSTPNAECPCGSSLPEPHREGDLGAMCTYKVGKEDCCEAENSLTILWPSCFFLIMRIWAFQLGSSFPLVEQTKKESQELASILPRASSSRPHAPSSLEL